MVAAAQTMAPAWRALPVNIATRAFCSAREGPMMRRTRALSDMGGRLAFRGRLGAGARAAQSAAPAAMGLSLPSRR